MWVIGLGPPILGAKEGNDLEKREDRGSLRLKEETTEKQGQKVSEVHRHAPAYVRARAVIYTTYI